MVYVRVMRGVSPGGGWRRKQIRLSRKLNVSTTKTREYMLVFSYIVTTTVTHLASCFKKEGGFLSEKHFFYTALCSEMMAATKHNGVPSI